MVSNSLEVETEIIENGRNINFINEQQRFSEIVNIPLTVIFSIKNIFMPTGNNSGFFHLRDPVCEFIHVECYSHRQLKY